MRPFLLASLFLASIPAAAPQAHAAVEAATASAQEGAETLVKRGRAALAAGKIDEAVADFAAAYELDPSPHSRVWVIRGWIAKGESQDALGAADELRGAGARADDVDYLFGLAMLGLAKSSLTSGGSAYTQSQFEDAAAALARATKSDAERYPDAWPALAECAWYAQQLPVARAAADKAVALEPSSPRARALLGRVAFSQYSGAQDAAEKQAFWQTARDAFEQAVKLFGSPADAWLRNELADAHQQLGHLHAFADDKPKASEHYSAAIGWDPSKVDFGAVRSVLGSELAAACMKSGEERFLATHSATDPTYATLSWWTGLSHFESAAWPECEASFRRAVELWPAYANSWYYVFRATYAQKKYGEALESLRTYHAMASEGLVQSLGGDKRLNVQVLDFLVGWCAEPGNHNGRARNLDAAFLAELLTALEPEVSRHWNNLGLFVRDHGDALRWARSPEATKERLEALWLRALAAYERALELEPENPNYINDTAVMFHYYLERDYDKALAMYQKAAVLADALLERKDLAPDVREVVKIAQRDAKNNTMKLKRLMEKIARGEAPSEEDRDN